MNFSMTITCIKYVELDFPYLFTYFLKSERFTGHVVGSWPMKRKKTMLRMII